MTTRHYPAGHATVPELHGELVAGNVLRLEPLIVRLLLQHDRSLVIDLAGVESADSTGVTLLSVAARTARASSPVRLAAPGMHLRPVLHARGVLTEVACYHTVDGAVREDAVDRIGDNPPTKLSRQPRPCGPTSCRQIRAANTSGVSTPREPGRAGIASAELLAALTP